MRFLNNILAKAGLIVDGVTQLNTIANATIDTDKFLVSDGGVIKYRTGAQLALDLGSLTASTLKHQVKLGEAIAKGQAVYVSSADGTNMIVSKASNTTDLTSSKTLGLLETGGALNAQVNVITEGLLAGLDTSMANAGDPVWLGTNGNLIFGLINKPSAPAHLVFIGVVTRSQSNNGEIFVKVQNGFELEELHNVAISSIANKDLLMYEAATSLWKNKTLGTVIGGSSTQYVKGDGTLGSFPDIGGGGGMVYYLNGSIASGVAGYSQMSRTPVLGAGTDFSKTGDGLICQFLTDVNDPSLLSVPSGAWRFGLYASMGTAGNSSKFYVEIYKYNGSTFTLIGTSSATPESVSNGTAVEYYTTTVAMSTTALSVTDRIAVRIYATDNNTRTMTIHTENSHLCDIATTFPTGISAINGLITPSQYLSTTTTGTDFTISSSSNTHYFNLPVASATVTGKLSSTDWSTFNNKQNALGYTPVNQTRTLTINGVSYDLTSDRTWSVGTVTSVGVSVPTGLSVSNTPVTGSGTIAISFTAGYSIPTTASQTNWDTAYNNRITSLTTTGTSGAATLTSNTLNIPQYQAQGSYITSLTGEATASGPGSASVTLTNSAVIGKVLTGLNVTGGTVLATDSILTAFGKLQNQVNGLAGGVTYQGTWNASTNSPSLTSSVGTKGYYYVVSVAGSTNLNGITDWKLGDWVIFNGNTWEKVDNTDAVVSVNGFIGAVNLTTANISESGNLYYTDSRARAALSFTAGSGGYNSSTGVITIPTNTNQLTNGAGFITGNQTITLSGDVTGSGATSISTTLANSGVVAGTYGGNNSIPSLVIDAKGRVTSASTVTPSGTWGISITGTAGSETLATVTSRGNSTTDRINVRGVGNQGGGNIMMGNTGEGTSKWSYLTGTHYNATSQSQGFALIGGLSTSTSNSVVIGGNIYETNPATEIQFWTHTATTHNLGGTQRAVINSSGSFGIGNLSPTYRLDVGTPNDNAIRIINSAGSNNNGIALSVGSGTPWIDFWGSVFDIKYNTSPGSWNGGNNRYVTITSGGNVGLTNTNPAYKLHVAGDIYADGGWLRVSGQSGLYFETYGGGWHMNDTTWVRSYNSKSVYLGTGIIRTDAGDTGFQNLGTANWYLLDFGPRSASAGGYGVGLTNDIANRTLSFHVPNHAAYSSSGNVPQFGWYSNGADQLMTLQSATGNLWTKGTISMAGNIVATQSWVTSQGYITSTNTNFTYNASITLSTSWQDTGVNNSNLSTSGVYMVTCYANDFGVSGGQYQVTYTGIMYWFAGSTNNTNFSEIPLHHMGHADNDRYIYLRTRTTPSAGGTFLQIRGNGGNSGASTYTFSFKRLM